MTSARPTTFQTLNGCGFKKKTFSITATGLFLLNSNLAALPARSLPDSASPWKIDLDYVPLLRQMARQRLSKLKESMIVLVF